MPERRPRLKSRIVYGNGKFVEAHVHWRDTNAGVPYLECIAIKNETNCMNEVRAQEKLLKRGGHVRCARFAEYCCV